MPQQRKSYEGLKAKIVSTIAICMTLYHILYISHAFEKIDLYIAAASHAGTECHNINPRKSGSEQT